MKKSKLITAAICIALGAPSIAKAETFLNILTGGTSGVYYPLGVALSTIYEDTIPDVRTSVQSTKASVENLNLLQTERGEVAFADSAGRAWRGEAEAGFPKPLDKLRVLAAVYPNYLQVVARDGLDINSLADLAGKRVAVGAPKSGTELHARTIFAAAGLTYEDFAQVEYLSFAESVQLMKNRQLDASLISSGLGVAAIRDLSTSVDIKVLALPEDVLSNIEDAGYVTATLPGGTYDGNPDDITIIGVKNYLMSHSGVSDELAYEMVKQMFDNISNLRSAHSAAREISLETATEGLPLPLHPGAERFYKETGVLTE
ncbi:TAXI family TRAP transporter solute-binding subunit [Sulfitobacter sp. AS92]|uniref:TAXI family TRAP transporter solute-binding subunit n=1 Tax=Sulfitobacter sp. AS92 TaxID=3135783 RepID=UPI00316D1D18